MGNEISKKLSKIIEKLNVIDTKYRLENSNALDIEDPIEARKVQDDTFEKIFEIKNCKSVIEVLFSKVSNEDWLKDPNDILSKAASDDLLVIVDYFDSLDKHYRLENSNAIDIEDPDEARKIQDDTFDKIISIKDFKILVEAVIDAFSISTFNEDFNVAKNSNFSNSLKPPSNESDLSNSRIVKTSAKDKEVISDKPVESEIRVYIKNKMRELSKSGYVFSETRFKALLSLQYRLLLNIPKPLFREYMGEVDIKDQIRDRIYDNYWEEVFSFGDRRVLIYKLWNDTSKLGFDLLYKSIIEETNNRVIVEEFVQDEAIEISENVLAKMVELSENGFVFSEIMYNQLLSGEFNKTLRIPHPFFKEYIEDIEISKQIKIGKYDRYWEKVFLFGDKRVLIYNQWFEGNRESFDLFYNGLLSNVVGEDYAEEVPANKVIQSPSFENYTVESEDINLADENSTIEQKSKSENDYKKKMPKKMTIFGKKYPVTSWDKVLIEVCEILLIRKPFFVAKLDKNGKLNYENVTNFSYIESDIKGNSKKLSNGLYFEVDQNPNDIVHISKKLLKLSGYCENDLVLEYEETLEELV